jgi:dTDP-4-amino-4,6-dideoxygalactose transaminase
MDELAIRLGHVDISEKAKTLVNKLLDEKRIGQSEIIGEFEGRFAKWAEVKHAVAVCNGTMADTIAISVLKHFNPGKDEVVVPALTFIAQINSIVYNGLKPVFVDVGADGLMNLEDALLKTSKKTLCIFPVHLLGKPVSATSVFQISGLSKIPIVEDACEAMGSESMNGGVGWMKCGTYGAIGTYSFFPSHTITTGEGGMLVTNDDDYAALARRLRNHGKVSNIDFHFDVIGFNGKMSGLHAAVGLGNMDLADEVVRRRRAAYFQLGGKEDDRLERICPHAFSVVLPGRKERDETLEMLREKGIECRNMFSSLPTQEKAYEWMGHKLGDFPTAERFGDCGLYVPCHQGLSDSEIQTIKGIIDAA